MKPLLLALVLILVCVLVTFSLLSALSVPKEFAASAGTIWGGALPWLHKKLDIAVSKKHIVSLEEFALPGGVVLCYAIVLAVAALQAPMLLGIFSGLQENNAKRVVMFSAIPLALLFAYLVARWIGVRSSPNGIWFLLVAFTVAVIADQTATLFFLPSEHLEPIEEESSLLDWRQWVVWLLFWNIIALIGFWRGRRIQLRRYIDYLLTKLPSNTRHDVLSLLRDEVQRLKQKI
jgi:hypothetical protein